MKGNTSSVVSVTIIPNSLKIEGRTNDRTIKIWNHEEANARILVPSDYKPKLIINNEDNNS